MTDDLKERLRDGVPVTKQILHEGVTFDLQGVLDLQLEALAYITDLEARLAAAEAKAKRWEESSNKMTEFYEHRGKLLEGVNAKLAAAEAGEDALATEMEWALPILEQHMTHPNDEHWLEWVRAALAAYEARRKG